MATKEQIVWASGKNIDPYGLSKGRHNTYIVYNDRFSKDPRRLIINTVRMVITPEDLAIVEQIDELLSKLEYQP